MRYIPLKERDCKEVVVGDGSVFHIGEEITVVAEENLNDKIVTGILTDIVGSYVSVRVPEYTLVVRSSSIMGR